MKIANHFKANYLLYAILAIAAFLRLYKIDFQSMWVDEILSMNDSNPSHSMKQLFTDVLYWEQMPHLYFYILRFLFEIFGFTVANGRILSALFGIFGVYAIYLFGRELYNKKAGLIAALFLAVNMFHISYSQEMRPYAMLFLFTTLSFYRLVILIRQPTTRNAIYYGIFTGLIINSHLLGMLTILAQCFVLLFYLINTEKQHRKAFLTTCLIAGGVVLALTLPGQKAIVQALEKKSFWLGPPTPTIYTDMFRDFFSKSEMVLFGAEILMLFYIFSVFKQKQRDGEDSLRKNRLIFSAVLFSIWTLVTLLLPLLKSYLDVSMILYRYFIGLLAVAILIPALATMLIRNKTVQAIAIIYIAGFSLVDLTVVRKYYSTVTKSQVRELTAEIVNRNPDKSQVVAFWCWLFPHYFEGTEVPVNPISQSLEEYVQKLRTGAQKEKPFWFADMNSRPFFLSPENQAYIDQKFILKEKLEYFDAWANYYVPKDMPAGAAADGLSLAMFKPGSPDADGKMTLFNAANLRSDFIALKKGSYQIIVKGQSLPAKPLNGENAHLKIKVNGNEIGNFFLTQKQGGAENVVSFEWPEDRNARFQIIYDNDHFENGQDRNAILYSVQLKKQ
jgi:mannosyltransferase